MSDVRPTYADAVRTRVTMQYADDDITITRESRNDTVDLLSCNRTGYLALDWRSYRTPMVVSILHEITFQKGKTFILGHCLSIIYNNCHFILNRCFSTFYNNYHFGLKKWRSIAFMEP